MAVSTVNPTRVEAIGSMTKLVMGSAGGSGTSVTVTIPGNVTVEAVLVGGNTSTTVPFCDTISGATFTVTCASNDRFTYIALVKGGI
jgi:hypothetical protein